MNLKSWQYVLLLLSPDGDGSGGEGGSEDDAREQGFQRLLDRNNNDGVSMARDLYRDNYTLRRKNATQAEELTTLRGKVPAEGSTILTADEAKAWAAYQAMGTPEEVKSIVEERGQLQGKLTTLERDDVLRQVADVSGYKFAVLKTQDTLETKVNGKTITYEVREVDEDGSKVKRAFLKEGDKELPVTDYAQEHWADLLPSLVVPQDTTNAQGRASGTYFPPQHQGSGGGNRQLSPVQQTKATLSKQYQSRDKTS